MWSIALWKNEVGSRFWLACRWRTPKRTQNHTHKSNCLWLCLHSHTFSITYFTLLFYHTRSSSSKTAWMRYIVVSRLSAKRSLMYRAMLMKDGECLLTVQWRPLWSTVKAAVTHTHSHTHTHVPCCSKDTLQKQCWSSACWRGALAATEGKGQRRKKTTSSNHYLGSDVSVSSDNACFNAHLLLHTLKVHSRLSDTEGF